MVALSDTPRDAVRFVGFTGAEPYLLDDRLVALLAAHPDVRLDVTVSNEPTDIVVAGIDASVRLGESVHKDMEAVPISGPCGWCWSARRRTANDTRHRHTHPTWWNRTV